MSETLMHVHANAIITGWDFSTGSVKCVAFNLNGEVVAEARFPTDLWTDNGVSELNLMLLEGQARVTTRAIASKLDALGRLNDWVAGGVSATHHTAGRIDCDNNPIRRAICWNDQTLASYHAEGLARLGGADKVQELLGGPWAVRYSLSHLVKDEQILSDADWERTMWILPHGSLAAGYLTSVFDCISISSAASMGLLNLNDRTWCRAMLDAIADPVKRELAWTSLPQLVGMNAPIGPLSESLALEAELPDDVRPLIFPTLDDQAAGLIGGGAVEPGQIAIILGNSAVVNSSADRVPESGSLDCMRLNWGPYLWMRCYSNGAQFLDQVVGKNAKFAELEADAKNVPPGCDGIAVLPFELSEPSIGVTRPNVQWFGPSDSPLSVRFRAALEAISYLIALAVDEHIAAGQTITRITVSGGIARSDLMLRILASVLNRPLHRLQADEGTALGAAVVALAGLESYRRLQRNENEPYTAEDAVTSMVRFRDVVEPQTEWVAVYHKEFQQFRERLSPSPQGARE